jgi:Holliday junction resolvase RusA-like endonuclease
MQRIFIQGSVPSVNKLYSTVHGRKVLVAEGRKFKNRVVAEIAAQLNPMEPLNKELALSVHVLFLVSKLLASTWNKKNGAENRFLPVDLDNKLKILLDCVSLATGIDDRNIFQLHTRKAECEEEGTWIFLSQSTQLEESLTFAYGTDPAALVGLTDQSVY